MFIDGGDGTGTTANGGDGGEWRCGLLMEKEWENYNDCERLAKAFLQELTTFELPLLKSKAVIDANLREKENFNELKDEINRQIIQAQADIEDLKKQLEESKIESQHKEECEAIRRLIGMQPPRSETQKVITDLEKEIAMLEAENTAGSRTLELRKKQFALMLHVLETFYHVSQAVKSSANSFLVCSPAGLKGFGMLVSDDSVL
ncbi:hypothetical protein Vadar_007086 [Vaccinium darrowii]|uniref:Uncharacterized protein n=1 Tax=Vaccinium darrowii TaxID=229202 RepID=A0ACB7X8I1_9ERIC|nr:hypothetical protein Vadar_007086 [Vaccinium darrowii]